MYTVYLLNNANKKQFEKLFSSYKLMQNFINKVKHGNKLTYLGHQNAFWHDN